METENPGGIQRETFLRLLDDPSGPVRKALLAHFQSLGAPAAKFLREVADGSHRTLVPHARWYLEELKFDDPVAEFRGFIRSLNYELESGALLLSRTVNPGLDVGACYTALDAMAHRCRELISEPATPREKCRIINRVLFHEWSFRGNTEHYTDPLNSFLDRVIARRKGLPISLSILYLLVANRLGLDLEPVGLPGHFVVGCFLEETPFFIDPFDQGLFRDPDELFELLRTNQIELQVADLAPTPVREVLCRCCRNLVNHYHASGEAERARLFASFVEEFTTTHERHDT